MDLIELLADGELHSGTDLAQRLQCSRTAVWKQLQHLHTVDLELDATPGRGYRLQRPIELLDRAVIATALNPAARNAIESLEVLGVTESTNEVLRAAMPVRPDHLRVALAEYQTGGRGRRGRRWLSPFGSGLCMSVSWTFAEMSHALPALSLAAGVAVSDALSAWQPRGLGLKWPNDIVADGAKLGGLLIDVQGESAGPISVVIGVGINIDPVHDLAGRFDSDASLAPVGLRDLVADGSVSRNSVASALVNSLYAMLLKFQSSGFAPFAAEWRRRDAMNGEQIRLHIGDRESLGVAAGISDDGALLFDDGERVRSIASGEVSLRRAVEAAGQ